MCNGVAFCALTFTLLGLLSEIAESSGNSRRQMPPQMGNGIVLGRVQDPDGIAMPGATVTLQGEGRMRKTTSDANGRYSMADVPEGKYTIEMELLGFRSFAPTDIVVTGGSKTIVDGVLRVNIGHSALAPDGVDATDPALARAVYEAILPRAHRNGSGGIFVVRQSLVFPCSPA
jgi:hypothetical protein